MLIVCVGETVPRLERDELHISFRCYRAIPAVLYQCRFRDFISSERIAKLHLRAENGEKLPNR